MKNNVSLVALVALLALSSFSAPAFAADSCQPVFDALTKVVTTPSHTYSTETAPFTKGQPRSTETIYLNGKVYVRMNDKWMNSPVTAADILKQEKENRANAKGTCQFVRNETVNGEPTMVYAINQETQYGKEEAQMWISRATGLALREELDVDRGAAGGKVHRSARFEYSNIRPPM